MNYIQVAREYTLDPAVDNGRALEHLHAKIISHPGLHKNMEVTHSYEHRYDTVNVHRFFVCGSQTGILRRINLVGQILGQKRFIHQIGSGISVE